MLRQAGNVTTDALTLILPETLVIVPAERVTSTFT
jgi:hypothetical protein